MVASGSETLEELSALAELARSVDSAAALVVPASADAPEDEILRRMDKTANQRGARMLGFTADVKALTGRAVIIACDADLRPDAGLSASIFSGLGSTQLIAMVAHRRAWADQAVVLLPLANAFEKDGVIVNFEGVVQRLNRAVPPPTDARPAHHHAAALAAIAALPALETDSAARLRALCAGAVPELAGLDPSRLSEWGARLPVEKGGAVTYVEEPHQLFTAAPKTLAEGEYQPFFQVEAPPPAIHVGAGQPPRDAARRAWFGPELSVLEEPASPTGADGAGGGK